MIPHLLHLPVPRSPNGLTQPPLLPAMTEVTCSVTYAEDQLAFELRVPSSNPAGEVKASAVKEIQKHMAQLFPEVQLEPTNCDIYHTRSVSSSYAHRGLQDPICSDNRIRQAELTTTDTTIVVRQKRSDSRNAGPVTDTFRNPKKQTLQANARINAAELIEEGEGSRAKSNLRRRRYTDDCCLETDMSASRMGELKTSASDTANEENRSLMARLESLEENEYIRTARLDSLKESYQTSTASFYSVKKNYRTLQAEVDSLEKQ